MTRVKKLRDALLISQVLNHRDYTERKLGDKNCHAYGGSRRTPDGTQRASTRRRHPRLGTR